MYEPTPASPALAIGEITVSQDTKARSELESTVDENPIVAAYHRLEALADALPVLTSYSEALAAGDQATASMEADFKERYGMAFVENVAATNTAKHLNLLLLAAGDIAKTGRATISLFGVYRTLHSYDEVQQLLEKVQEDFAIIATPETPFVDKFSRMGKYLLDSRDMEAIHQTPVRTHIFEYPSEKLLALDKLLDRKVITRETYEERKALLDSNTKSHIDLVEKLQTEGAIDTKELQPNGEPFVTSSTLPFSGDPRFPVRDGVAKSIQEVWLSRNVLRPKQEVGDIVIVHLPGVNAMHLNSNSYQQLVVDYWYKLQPEERPTVIFYADGFTPSLSDQDDLQVFSWASDVDQLRNLYALAKERTLQSRTALSMPEILSPLQEQQYNVSNLREWDTVTADTGKSLEMLLARIHMRSDLEMRAFFESIEQRIKQGKDVVMLPKELSLAPDRAIRTILDLGTGEGRIGQILARLGFDVVGLDISEEQLKRGQERLKEEGQGLRGEVDRPGLSYHALRQLQEQGVIRETVLLDDDETAGHYVTHKGDMFELDAELNQLLIDWQKLYPDIDLREFFHVSTHNKEAFSNPHDMFADAGFDMVLLNWHMLCEIGDPKNLPDLLRRIKNVLWLGGEVAIEIPDRNIEPYLSQINEYHKVHPDEPLGTLRASFPDPNDSTRLIEYSPRYFPDINEIVLNFQAAGFEIDPERDIHIYLIEQDNPETGKKELKVKEFFVTARKPRM